MGKPPDKEGDNEQIFQYQESGEREHHLHVWRHRLRGGERADSCRAGSLRRGERAYRHPHQLERRRRVQRYSHLQRHPPEQCRHTSLCGRCGGEHGERDSAVRQASGDEPVRASDASQRERRLLRQQARDGEVHRGDREPGGQSGRDVRPAHGHEQRRSESPIL